MGDDAILLMLHGIMAHTPRHSVFGLRRGYRVLLLRIAVDYALLKAFPAGFVRHNSLNS